MVVLRQATEDDFLSVALILESAKVQMFTEGINQWDGKYAVPENLWRDMQAGQLYVAVDDGKIVGHITIVEQQEPQYHDEDGWRDGTGQPCCIRRMAVDPKYWGQGIGTAVVEAALEEIGRRAYTSVRFDAFQKNPHIQRVVDKAGFERVGIVQFSKGPYDLCERILH